MGLLILSEPSSPGVLGIKARKLGTVVLPVTRWSQDGEKSTGASRRFNRLASDSWSDQSNKVGKADAVTPPQCLRACRLDRGRV